MKHPYKIIAFIGLCLGLSHGAGASYYYDSLHPVSSVAKVQEGHIIIDDRLSPNKYYKALKPYLPRNNKEAKKKNLIMKKSLTEHLEILWPFRMFPGVDRAVLEEGARRLKVNLDTSLYGKWIAFRYYTKAQENSDYFQGLGFLMQLANASMFLFSPFSSSPGLAPKGSEVVFELLGVGFNKTARWRELAMTSLNSTSPPAYVQVGTYGYTYRNVLLQSFNAIVSLVSGFSVIKRLGTPYEITCSQRVNVLQAKMRSEERENRLVRYGSWAAGSALLLLNIRYGYAWLCGAQNGTILKMNPEMPRHDCVQGCSFNRDNCYYYISLGVYQSCSRLLPDWVRPESAYEYVAYFNQPSFITVAPYMIPYVLQFCWWVMYVMGMF